MESFFFCSDVKFYYLIKVKHIFIFFFFVFLKLIFFFKKLLCFFEIRRCYIVKFGFELVFLLPQPSQVLRIFCIFQEKYQVPLFFFF